MRFNVAWDYAVDLTPLHTEQIWDDTVRLVALVAEIIKRKVERVEPFTLQLVMNS